MCTLQNINDLIYKWRLTRLANCLMIFGFFFMQSMRDSLAATTSNLADEEFSWASVSNGNNPRESCDVPRAPPASKRFARTRPQQLKSFRAPGSESRLEQMSGP